MGWVSSSPLQDFGLFIVTGTPLMAAMITGLRYYARYRSTGIALEDHLIAIATIFSIIIIWPSWVWIKMLNFGIHVWKVNPMKSSPDFDKYYKIQMVFNMFNNPILPLVKASIMLVLLKIGGFLTVIRRCIWALFIFNALSCIIPEFFLLFQCKETASGHWETRTFGGAHCMGRRALGRLNIFQVSVSMFTDLLVFPIPIYLTLKLQKLNLKTKLLVLCLFSLSFLVTILGALRIYFTYEDRLFARTDADWTFYGIRFVVQHAENNLAIIFACVPSLKSLVSRCCGGDRHKHHVYTPKFTTGYSLTSFDMGSSVRKVRSWVRRPSAFRSSSSTDLKEIVSVESMSRAGKDMEVGMQHVEVAHLGLKNSVSFDVESARSGESTANIGVAIDGLPVDQGYPSRV